MSFAFTVHGEVPVDDIEAAKDQLDELIARCLDCDKRNICMIFDLYLGLRNSIGEIPEPDEIDLFVFAGPKVNPILN